MKKYYVQASYTVYCHAIVEANTEEEARQIAKDMDGGDFDEDGDSPYGDWNINNVNEMGD